MHVLHVKGEDKVVEKAGALPRIHHVQIKLTEEQYDLLNRLSHAALEKVTPYAREIFLAALKKEQVRLGLPETKRKPGLH